MTEVEIGELLESDLAAYNLVVQVTQQDEYLLITLNRPADSNLCYTALTEAITAQIKTLQLPGIHTLVVYSRVLGEYDVDWYTQLELISPPEEPISQELQEQEEPRAKASQSVASRQSPQVGEPAHGNVSSFQAESASDNNERKNQSPATPITPQFTSEVEATVESVDATVVPQQFKLSDYCFTRNKALLTSEILPPPEKIAKLVCFFHALPDSSKECILPILEPYFHSSEPVANEQFDLEVQQWFEQLTQLNNTEARKASIWFSRYCFDPENTMAEVMVVLEPETPKAAAASHSQEPVITSPPEQAPTTVSRAETAQKRTPQAPTRTNIPKTKRIAQPANWQLLALPIGWVFLTIIVITLAIRSVNPSELVDTACRNSIGKQENCQLAVQLVGELTFQEASQDAVPLNPPGRDQSLLKACEVLGNIRAGKTFKESIETNIPVLSSSGEEVVPGIFIADVKQTNFKEGGSTVRTACVFKNTRTRPELLGTDVISNSWPDEPYKSKPIHQETLRKVLGIYNVFITLGAGTLFTAIGIFIAAVFGLGIRLYSLETLVKAAFLLGIIETIISTIPIFGWFAAIALESLALGLVSAVVKDFHIEWAGGYQLVAAGAIAIIAVRYLLTLALFGLIASLVH